MKKHPVHRYCASKLLFFTRKAQREKKKGVCVILDQIPVMWIHLVNRHLHRQWNRISDHLLGKFNYPLQTREYPKHISLDHTHLHPLFQQEKGEKQAFQAQAMHPCLMQMSNIGRPSDWLTMPHLSSTHYSRMRDDQFKLNTWFFTRLALREINYILSVSNALPNFLPSIFQM